MSAPFLQVQLAMASASKPEKWFPPSTSWIQLPLQPRILLQHQTTQSLGSHYNRRSVCPPRPLETSFLHSQSNLLPLRLSSDAPASRKHVTFPLRTQRTLPVPPVPASLSQLPQQPTRVGAVMPLNSSTMQPVLAQRRHTINVRRHR